MSTTQNDLGCMNGWGQNKPAEYIEHSKNCEKNQITVTVLGRCYDRYDCKQCGCSWTVDSSD